MIITTLLSLIIVPVGSLCSIYDPNFDGFRYPEHIAHCKRNVASSLKKEIKVKYNIPQSEWSNYQVDHKWSLFIGGSNNEDNLWPLDLDHHKTKEPLERRLLKGMEAGEISQQQAIRAIEDWASELSFEGFNGPNN